jgi:hypothetical protein
MHKKIIYGIAAFALILLCVEIGRTYFSSAFPRMMNAADSSGVTRNASQLSERHLAELPGVLPGRMHHLDHESAKPSVASSNNNTAEAKTSSSAGIDVPEGNLVIGNPFPISTSMQNSCKQNPDCDRMKAALKEMEQEPRDNSWATDMEGKLQDYSASFGPDKYTVRAVECRESLCAIEAASTYGLLPFALPYDSPLGSQLSAWDSWTAHETDPLGAKITVTLSMYRRR